MHITHAPKQAFSHILGRTVIQCALCKAVEGSEQGKLKCSKYIEGTPVPNSEQVMEDGARCASCLNGHVHLKVPAYNCYCHTSPPCSNCLEAPLKCDSCGQEYEFLE